MAQKEPVNLRYVGGDFQKQREMLGICIVSVVKLILLLCSFIPSSKLLKSVFSQVQAHSISI